MSLRERQKKMSRKLLRVMNLTVKGDSEQLSDRVMESQSININPFCNIPSGNAPNVIVKNGPSDNNDLHASDKNVMINYESNHTSSHDKITSMISSCQYRALVPSVSGSHTDLHSELLTHVQLKAEPVDCDDLSTTDKNVLAISLTGLIPLKTEQASDDSIAEDKIDTMILQERINKYMENDDIDHVLLQDRINMMKSKYESRLKFSNNLVNVMESVHPFLERIPIISKSDKPSSNVYRRKRKSTDTISVEAAMEKDAPGLLKALIEKGLLVDELRFYGVSENDDSEDGSFVDDSFAEFEAVMSQILIMRQSIIKLASVRRSKSVRDSYCLSCLCSLIEQSRYLRFRDWPVDWGWCRDLRAFIFVFPKHNRIVLERPEYGYATYFFEIIHSLPLHWQVKRMVIFMKLTNCSRLALIENKPLEVGKDLSEGEANVLMEYGWVPNTGIAEFLNYDDRVVHNRKIELGTEWRSKIAKLLSNGYDGGRILCTNIPIKALDHKSVKVEF